MKRFRLDGKAAIITGASRGIGRAIALELASAGASVIVSSRKQEACEAVADEIRAVGGKAEVIACNVAKKNEVENLVKGAKEAFGPIDILVSNAAANPVFGPMHKVDDAAFDKIMDTNLKAAFWLANLLAPDMAERRGGSIILISSIAGLGGTRNIGVYGISKAADAQLARNLAVEWGAYNVRANCISPGLIRTDFARTLWENPELLKAVEEKTPLGRIGEPEDIAGLALFLASDAASFITGQNFVADGGATIANTL